MKTHSVKPSEIKQKWFVVDATDKVLGRVASQIAHVLRGKHKPMFVPYLECGDHVIVVNAKNIRMTKNKLKDKSYFHHSGYQGGIKEVRAEELIENKSDRLITHAVKGMLPHNTLGKKLIKNLYVYAGNEHPHKAQQPEALIERTVGRES